MARRLEVIRTGFADTILNWSSWLQLSMPRMERSADLGTFPMILWLALATWASALINATAVNVVETVGLLLGEGVDVNAAAADGLTPLTMASAKNYLEIVHLLKAHGAVE